MPARQALRKASLLAMLALTAASALAQPAASPQGACTPETCNLQDFEAARAVTETLYGDVLTALAAHERPALRSDQNQWRRAARQHCNRLAPLRGEAGAPGNNRHHACMIQQHMERRQALRHWLMNGYIVD